MSSVCRESCGGFYVIILPLAIAGCCKQAITLKTPRVFQKRSCHGCPNSLILQSRSRVSTPFRKDLVWEKRRRSGENKRNRVSGCNRDTCCRIWPGWLSLLLD